MPRKLIAVVLFVTGLSSVLAEGGASRMDGDATEPVPAAREVSEILEEAGELPLSDLTVSYLIRIANLASVAHQQEMHIRKSGGLSMFVPGLGQYINGETGKALSFFAADLAITSAAAVLGYFLLPAAVQHANLNYLQTRIGDIETRWKSLTVAEFLPSAAVAVSASILSAVVRNFASRDARDLAIQAIVDGRVVFEPALLISGNHR